MGWSWSPFIAQSISMGMIIEVLENCGVSMELYKNLRGYVKGFGVFDEKKNRRRPIFELIINSFLDKNKLPSLRYPSRAERRASLLWHNLRSEIDASAYFDQFPLSEDVSSFYVLRNKDENGVVSFFTLSRLPMGATFAPFVAQTTTWIVVHPVRFVSSTMLDNVRFATKTEEEFSATKETLFSRFARANITLNEKKEEILPTPQLDSLGESFNENEVRNTESNIKRFEKLLNLVENKNWNITKRLFAGVMGHACYLAHSVNFPLYDAHQAMRAYSDVCKEDKNWDDPYTVFPPLINAIKRLTSPLLKNDYVNISPLCRPTTNTNDYDIIIIIDASKTGWGAYVLFVKENRIICLTQAWRADATWRGVSASAEPHAISNLLLYLRKNCTIKNPHIAVVTDHSALVTGQRRWYSFCGGFSCAYELNRAFKTLYDWDPRAQLFFVEGIKNTADGPSRAADSNLFISERPLPLGFVFPSLKDFSHPFIDYERNDIFV